jgi:hypothetical protein
MSAELERARGGLQKIAADLLRGAPAEDGAVIVWPLVCGAAVAERTRAVEVNAGVLKVEVPDESWRMQLMSFLPSYLETLRRLWPAGKVERIIFQIAVGAKQR